MNKKYIIKKKSEIDAVFNTRVRKGNSYFTIYKKTQEKNANFRFAMSIGKKFGNAVERNKIKRQIRSIIREHQLKIDNKFEFVVVIKPQSCGLSFTEISNNIVLLLNNLKIMEK